jgi:hypothetical protein
VTITISRTVTDGNTKNTFTSATAAFTSADLKASLTGAGIAAGTTVQAVLNSTTVALNQAQTVATGLSVTITRSYTVTLPAGPNPGTRIGIIMVANQILADLSCSTVTVDSNGSLLFGAGVNATTMVIGNTQDYFEFLYSGRLGAWYMVSKAVQNNAVQPTGNKTGAYTAAAGDLVLCDTTSAAFTVTLPLSPHHGAVVTVKLLIRPGTNNVTVAPTGPNTIYEGNQTLSTVFQSRTFQYNANQGCWIITNGYL